MTRETTILLGVDHFVYGRYALRTQRGGHTACALSVGSDPLSPARQFKARVDVPNEDALAVVDVGQRTLLVLADAHFGHQASHYLVSGLAAAPVPADPFDLMRAVLKLAAVEAEPFPSRCTLLAAVWDRAAGQGFGVSFGDSSLFVLSRDRPPLRVHSHNDAFVSPWDRGSLDPGRAIEFEFSTRPGDLVVGFTDGVDGCHYGFPETSVTSRHLHELMLGAEPTPETYACSLTELALAGVDGHPGGQDNLAVVVAASG